MFGSRLRVKRVLPQTLVHMYTLMHDAMCGIHVHLSAREDACRKRRARNVQNPGLPSPPLPLPPWRPTPLAASLHGEPGPDAPGGLVGKVMWTMRGGVLFASSCIIVVHSFGVSASKEIGLDSMIMVSEEPNALWHSARRGRREGGGGGQGGLEGCCYTVIYSNGFVFFWGGSGLRMAHGLHTRETYPVTYPRHCR